MDLERRLVRVAVLIFLLAISAGLAGEGGIAGFARESVSRVCHLLAVLAAAGCLILRSTRLQRPSGPRVGTLPFSMGREARYRWVALVPGHGRGIRGSRRMTGGAG